ncbi:MAG TPA: hypothetical protein VKY74_28405 [Chloroflexia bacterium]|nr:hypothetical protein [Chloroflexia bacterium]
MKPPARRDRRGHVLLILLAAGLLLGIATTQSRHSAVQAQPGLRAPLTTAGDGDRVQASGDLIIRRGDVVAHDASALLGNVVVEAGAEVKHDVLAPSGAITIDGHVGHDVVATNGPIVIRGSVDHNVTALSGDVTLAASARVGGDVGVVNGSLHRAAGAQVGGKVSVAQDEQASGDGGMLGWILRLLGNLVLAVLFVAVGTLLILAWPRQIGRVVATLETAPGPATLVGLVTGVFLPPVAALLTIILAITVIGLLLVPVLGLALFLAWVYGLVIAGLWAGRRLADSGHLPAARGSLLLTAATGLGLIGGLLAVLTALLPGWIGWPTAYFVSLPGLGAAVLGRLGDGQIRLPGLPYGPRATHPLQTPPTSPPDRKAS